MTYRHSGTARAVLTSLVPVLCPPEAASLGAAIIDHTALTLAAMPALLRHLVPAGFATYDLGAVPRYRRRAHSLAPAQVEAYYARWERGPTPVHVQFARALNQLVSLACYEQPEMMERVGYRPAPWIADVAKRRLTVFADDIRTQAAQLLAPDPLRRRTAGDQEVA